MSCRKLSLFGLAHVGIFTTRAGGRGASAPHPAHLCTAPTAGALPHPLSIAPPSARLSQAVRHQQLMLHQHHLANQGEHNVAEHKQFTRFQVVLAQPSSVCATRRTHAFCRMQFHVLSLLCDTFQCKCNHAHDNTGIDNALAKHFAVPVAL